MTLTKEFFNATMKNTGHDQDPVLAFMQETQKGHNSIMKSTSFMQDSPKGHTSRMKTTSFMQDLPKGHNSRMKSTYKRASSMKSVKDMAV